MYYIIYEQPSGRNRAVAHTERGAKNKVTRLHKELEYHHSRNQLKDVTGYTYEEATQC